MKVVSIGLILACASECYAWGKGVVGHEVIATIANIYLHDAALQKLQGILPDWTGGRLAPIAAWADRIRFKERWTGPLHYVSPLDDFPPNSCHFDPDNVRSNINVLTAIQNYTSRFKSGREDIDLRFLVHYIGDVHQPLHLILRERGGNGDPVLFEGRHMSLHGLWDTQLIAKTLRTQTNYTRPLPSRHVENILRGSIYDPYIRFILWEGIRSWWADDIIGWLQCPESGSATGDRSQLVLERPHSAYAPCPDFWAAPIHQYTCSHVFPPHYNGSSNPQPELSGKDYYGRIQNDKVIERLLAQGGIRLAATLNAILAPTESQALKTDWIQQALDVEATWQWKYLGLN